MEFAYTINGGAPLIKRYQASATLSTAGIQLLGGGVATTDIGSVIAGTASTAVTVGQQAGVSLDTTGTVAATGTEEADILVSVIVNPDAVYRVKMSGGATSDTALATGGANTTSAADSTGADLTGVTTIDDGMAWGFDNSNIGIFRRADDTSGSMAISFPNAVGSGDVYLIAHGYPCTGASLYFDLTTAFDQIDSSDAITDMDNFILVDVETNGSDQSGATNSYYHVVQNNSMFGCTNRS